jgi:hypothetical protein
VSRLQLHENTIRRIAAQLGLPDMPNRPVMRYPGKVPVIRFKKLTQQLEQRKQEFLSLQALSEPTDQQRHRIVCLRRRLLHEDSAWCEIYAIPVAKRILKAPPRDRVNSDDLWLPLITRILNLAFETLRREFPRRISYTSLCDVVRYATGKRLPPTARIPKCRAHLDSLSETVEQFVSRRKEHGIAYCRTMDTVMWLSKHAALRTVLAGIRNPPRIAA